MDKVLETTPPHDAEIERALLHCVLTSDEARAAIALSSVKKDDLYVPFHQDVYGAMKEVFAAGKVPDAVTVAVRMDREKYPDVIVKVSELFNSHYLSTNIEQYVDEVLHASRVRQLRIACSSFIQQTSEDWRNTKSLPDLRCEIENAVEASHRAPAPEECYEAYLTRVEEARQRSKASGMPGIPTGFRTLDDLIGGWTEGLWFIAGWSNLGKTSLLTDAVLAAAAAGYKVRVESLDMPYDEFIDRIVLRRTDKITSYQMRMRRLDDDQYQVLVDETMELLSKEVYFAHHAPTIESLEATAAKYAESMDLWVIENLQSIQIEKAFRSQDGRARLEYILNRLKTIKTRYKLPILIGCQMSNSPNGRDTDKSSWWCPKPDMNSLFGSREITHEAMGIIAPWRSGYPKPQPEDGEAAILLLKYQRGGGQAEFPVEWDDRIGRYVEITDEPEQGRLV